MSGVAGASNGAIRAIGDDVHSASVGRDRRGGLVVRQMRPGAISPYPEFAAVFGLAATQVLEAIAHVRADRRFHLCLPARGGNQNLMEGVNGLRARTRLSALDTLACPDDLGAPAGEHDQLIDLVLAAHVQYAAARMRRHLQAREAHLSGGLGP